MMKISPGREALRVYVSGRHSLSSNLHSRTDSAEEINLRLNRCAQTCLMANGISAATYPVASLIDSCFDLCSSKLQLLSLSHCLGLIS